MDNKIPRRTQQVSQGRKLFWVERLSEEDKPMTTKLLECINQETRSTKKAIYKSQTMYSFFTSERNIQA
jgi:hypothetical protein